AFGMCELHPVTTLLPRRVCKSDDDNDRIAAGAVYLDFHLIGVHAINRGGVNFRQHVAAELQKIAATKSAKYPSKVKCNGCLKILSKNQRCRRTTSYLLASKPPIKKIERSASNRCHKFEYLT